MDEPEAESVPMIPAPQNRTQINMVDDSNIAFDRMSEDELLRGLDGLVAPPPAATSGDDDGDE